MKIGIFGDSFAEQVNPDLGWTTIWWRLLKKKYKHDVACFGESGSSITFSADLISRQAQQFDIIIWCVTSPGRISFKRHTGNGFIHYNTTSSLGQVDNHLDREALQVCIDYQKYIQNWDYEILVARSLVEYIQQTVPNLLIIPCFNSPLESKFNLFTVSRRELQPYFGHSDFIEVTKNYQDIRLGHLCKQNNEILADLINRNLTPGIFTADYNDFIIPADPISFLFQKR